MKEHCQEIGLWQCTQFFIVLSINKFKLMMAIIDNKNKSNK